MKTRFNTLIAGAAAAAMLTMSTAAAAAPAANPAARLSVAGTRAGAPATKNSKIGASVPGATLISIGILAALVAIVLVATDGDSSDSN